MKKMLIVLSVSVCLFSFNVGFAAEDGASLYKTHCQSCHGADGSKGPGNAGIKGRSSADMLKVLVGYKDGSYGGARKQVMVDIVKPLSDEQLKIISGFTATL